MGACRSRESSEYSKTESGVSSEVVVRLDAYPKMRDALKALRPKMLLLSRKPAQKPQKH